MLYFAPNGNLISGYGGREKIYHIILWSQILLDIPARMYGCAFLDTSILSISIPKRIKTSKWMYEYIYYIKFENHCDTVFVIARLKPHIDIWKTFTKMAEKDLVWQKLTTSCKKGKFPYSISSKKLSNFSSVKIFNMKQKTLGKSLKFFS